MIHYHPRHVPEKSRGVFGHPVYSKNYDWSAPTNPSTELPSRTPLFTCSSPEPIDSETADGNIFDTVDTNVSSHLNGDYFESENPWEEKIAYF